MSKNGNQNKKKYQNKRNVKIYELKSIEFIISRCIFLKVVFYKSKSFKLKRLKTSDFFLLFFQEKIRNRFVKKYKIHNIRYKI